MLYNPKWQQPTLDSFIAFLASKPAREIYDFNNPSVCAVTQYFESTCGAERGWKYRIAMKLDNIAQGHPRTFGAALKRAMAVESEGRKS